MKIKRVWMDSDVANALKAEAAQLGIPLIKYTAMRFKQGALQPSNVPITELPKRDYRLRF